VTHPGGSMILNSVSSKTSYHW